MARSTSERRTTMVLPRLETTKTYAFGAASGNQLASEEHVLFEQGTNGVVVTKVTDPATVPNTVARRILVKNEGPPPIAVDKAPGYEANLAARSRTKGLTKRGR
jgi:hypothetical protein